MARPRTITIDRLALLAGIRREYDAEHEKLTKELEGRDNTWTDGYRVRQIALQDLAELGVVSDVGTFVGSSLTGTERLYYQRELRACERDGLVTIDGDRARRVMLTDKGLAWLASASEPSPSPIVDPLASAQE